jgi:hypothetical protein
MIYNKTKLSARLQLAGIMIWEVSAATSVEVESVEGQASTDLVPNGVANTFTLLAHA